MFEIPRVVPKAPRHKHISKRGGLMDNKKPEEYAATYQFGKTTVHVVAPPPMSQEEKDRILEDYHRAAWNIINDLLAKGKLEG